MSDEREAMWPHEARDQPTYEFQRNDKDRPSGVPSAEQINATLQPGSPIRDELDRRAAADDSLQQLARDLEAAGHAEFAARLSILLEHDIHVLPQIEVSPPVPEPTLPETAMVELTERVAIDEKEAK